MMVRVRSYPLTSKTTKVVEKKEKETEEKFTIIKEPITKSAPKKRKKSTPKVKAENIFAEIEEEIKEQEKALEE